MANFFQFSSPNFSVTEDCTTVTITVNRTGDTSGPASVNYNTSNGSATERMDYITAFGQLSFAAAETSKSFAVLINEDSYVEGHRKLQCQPGYSHRRHPGHPVNCVRASNGRRQRTVRERH